MAERLDRAAHSVSVRRSDTRGPKLHRAAPRVAPPRVAPTQPRCTSAGSSRWVRGLEARLGKWGELSGTRPAPRRARSPRTQAVDGLRRETLLRLWQGRHGRRNGQGRVRERRSAVAKPPAATHKDAAPPHVAAGRQPGCAGFQPALERRVSFAPRRPQGTSRVTARSSPRVQTSCDSREHGGARAGPPLLSSRGDASRHHPPRRTS